MYLLPVSLKSCLLSFVNVCLYVVLRQGCGLSPTIFNIYTQKASENWQKKCANMGLEIQDTTIYSMLFPDDQLLISQDYEDLEY